MILLQRPQTTKTSNNITNGSQESEKITIDSREEILAQYEIAFPKPLKETNIDLFVVSWITLSIFPSTLCYVISLNHVILSSIFIFPYHFLNENL
jgi:hypothetical protein